jgi:AcrR family transcriptional regulator
MVTVMAGSRPSPAERREHRTTPAHGEETRARLVAVATELFAAHGHAAVTMEQVSSLAAVTRGALYHHFSGKDDLFRAVCEQVAATVTDQVIEAARAKPDAWSRLQSGCRAFLDACTDQGVRQILLTDAPSVLGWAGFREMDARYGLGLLRAGIQAAMDQGSIEPGPVDALAHLLVAALDEAAMLVGRAASPATARREATLVIDRILAGIAGAAAQPAWAPKAGSHDAER